MSERPVRWLDGPEATAERALLESASPAEPPAGAEDRIWAALALRIDGSGGGGPRDPGGGAELGAGLTLGTFGALKAAGVGAIAGLVVAGAATFATDSGPHVAHVPVPAAAPTTELAPTPRHAAEAPPPGPLRAPAPAVASVRIAPSGREVAAPPSSVAVLEDSAEVRASQLREESRALQAVRTALRRGDAPGALATLEATRVRFPTSVLGQEREALTIQALAHAGQTDAARARARAFLAKFPTSPHAPGLQRFAQP